MIRLIAISVLLLSTIACQDGGVPSAADVRSRNTTSPVPTQPPDSTPSTEPSSTPPTENRWVTRRPSWLGERILPIGPEGFGVADATPKILRNRRLPTIDILPRPISPRFRAHIGPVPRAVVERSTWRPKCPVTLEQLSYIKMPFWGFDHATHMGEMITNSSVAQQLIGVFRTLYRERYPIEEMRVVTLKEQREWHTAPTGDTNVTSSFECRPATLGTNWSEHAYGLAVDVNPFHNPYLRGSLVAPELARAYTDRTWERPGMILEGGAVTQAFDSIGWGWGGRWSSLKDWMHFSQSGG
jgi:hypothetical protein